MNPRPLGYEPYDIGLYRLGLSLAGVVTSADRTNLISLCRLRLPHPVLSRRVRLTNRFTGLPAVESRLEVTGSSPVARMLHRARLLIALVS